MKRALMVGAGTVAGVAAVLALNPEGTVAATGTLTPATRRPVSAGPAQSGSTSATSSSGASSGSTGTTSGSTTATGSSVDVGYGTVQVQATLRGGRIVDIQAMSLPQNDGHSALISQQAFPLLVQQALAAQSSQVAGVSGASYTSYGFVESLKAALLSVGHSA